MTSAQAHSDDDLLGSGWWAFGLALPERAVGAARIAATAQMHDRAGQRLARWRNTYLGFVAQVPSVLLEPTPRPAAHG